MKVYSIYTDEIILLRDLFLNSIKDDNWDVNIFYMGNAGEGGGDVGSKGYLELMKKRVEIIIRTIDDNMGDVIIWSDLDIQFFEKCSVFIEEAIAGKDIVFQAERSPELDEVNAGFCVIRCTDKTRSLFDSIRNTDIASLPQADQTAMNNLLRENKHALKWGLLPYQFWAMSQGVFSGTYPPVDIVFHHANCTFPTVINGQRIGSIERKIRQLEQVKEYIEKLKSAS